MTPVRHDRTDGPRTARPHPRVTDRVEDIVAWVLMAAGLVVLVGSCMVGLTLRAQMIDRAGIESAQRTKISAVLLEASGWACAG